MAGELKRPSASERAASQVLSLSLVLLKDAARAGSTGAELASVAAFARAALPPPPPPTAPLGRAARAASACSKIASGASAALCCTSGGVGLGAVQTLHWAPDGASIAGISIDGSLYVRGAFSSPPNTHSDSQL